MKKNVLKQIKPFISKYEPEILMSMGLCGMIFSTVSAIKGTIKAVRLIDAKKEVENKKSLAFKDIFKATWKCYIVSVISTAISIPCIVTGNRVSSKRNAALAAAYTLSEAALQEYQEKTKEIAGEKKEQQIHEAVSQETVNKTYQKSGIILTGDGDCLFYESITGRYFKSNWNKILNAANVLNAEAINNMSGYVTLTDWLNELGLSKTEVSDELGWTVSNGANGLIKVTVDATITEQNIPCGVIHYVNRPTHI